MNRITKWALFGFALLAACVIFDLPTTAKKPAQKKATGEQIFGQQCASCHTGGGNLVNAKRPLAGSPKLASEALFKDYLSNPTGHMPYYKNLQVDKAALKSLYEYCKTLKQPIKQAMLKDGERLD
jgi:mono/diheme cytochrome c family protein